MIWIWLGVVISLLLIEYMSRNFSAICFAISGLASCILTRSQSKYNIQLAVFLIGGIFLLLVVRPLCLKLYEKRCAKKEEEKAKLEEKREKPKTKKNKKSKGKQKKKN